MTKKLSIRDTNPVVGVHNGITIRVERDDGQCHFYGDADDKRGSAVSAPSFKALTKKIDRLGLQHNALHPWKGKTVVMLDRYREEVSGAGVVTGKTRTRWTEAWGGRRAQHREEIEIETTFLKGRGKATQWVAVNHCILVDAVTRARLLRWQAEHDKVEGRRAELGDLLRKTIRRFRDGPRAFGRWR